MKKLAFIVTSTLISLAHLQAADGKAVYAQCAACHAANGQGIPNVFPPLAESEWVNGPVENLIRIQLRGLTGSIEVKGTTYNGAMPPVAHLSDDDIAAVLTYIRSSFGNNSSAVTADQVKALRSEAGKPPLTVADLVDPKSAPQDKTEEATPAEEKKEDQPEQKAPAPQPEATKEISGKVTPSEKLAGPNYLIVGSIAVWTVICIIPVLIGMGRR